MFTEDLRSNHLLLSDLQEGDSTDFPIRIPKGYHDIVASTDGLLLVQSFLCYSLTLAREEEKIKLCVHNPVIDSQRLLPQNPNLSPIGGIFSIVYDGSIEKYKVVVFFDGGHAMLNEMNIITVEDDSDGDGGGREWRKLISPSTFCLRDVFKPITANGILHWLAYTSNNIIESSNYYDPEVGIAYDPEVGIAYDTECVALVQSMDIAKEEFLQGISLPCQPKRDPDRLLFKLINCNLLEMKGSLYFSNPATDVEFELWMLEEEEEDLANRLWVMKHKICLLSIVGKPTSLSSFLVSDSFYPIQIIGNHGWMIIRHHDDSARHFLDRRNWYLYNLKSGRLKAIVNQGKKCYRYSRQQITHVKSLVS